MSQKIFGELVHEGQRGWDAFESHLPHRRYHDPDVTATPAPEAPMNVLDTLKTDYDEVLAKVKEFGEAKLPAALTDVQKLEGNPVVDALLSAAHVPDEALSMVVNVIQGLENLYKPETDSPVPAAPADPVNPEPAPATA